MGQVNSVGIEMMYCVKYNVTNLYVLVDLLIYSLAGNDIDEIYA